MQQLWIFIIGTPATAQAVIATMPRGGVSRPNDCVIDHDHAQVHRMDADRDRQRMDDRHEDAGSPAARP